MIYKVKLHFESEVAEQEEKSQEVRAKPWFYHDLATRDHVTFRQLSPCSRPQSLPGL